MATATLPHANPSTPNDRPRALPACAMSTTPSRASAGAAPARASATAMPMATRCAMPPPCSIRALAIPPAYTAVWICAHANGHLQATGRDARGRKQYRYHADWAKERDAGKFDRIIAFGEALPTLRRRLSRSQAQRFPAERCWRWWSRCWPTPWCGSAMKPMPTEPFVRTDHAAQPASGAARRPRAHALPRQVRAAAGGDRGRPPAGLLVRACSSCRARRCSSTAMTTVRCSRSTPVR
jgi:hypothetical protein